MNDVVEFVAAVVAIAKDPKAFEKRLGDAAEAAEKLAEARKLRKEADDIRKQGEADLAAAEELRGRAEHVNRTAAQQSTANANFDRDLKVREQAVSDAEAKLHDEHAARNAAIERLEVELAEREKTAEKKLAEAQSLMAAYDEAKHQAALKLAS